MIFIQWLMLLFVTTAWPSKGPPSETPTSELESAVMAEVPDGWPLPDICHARLASQLRAATLQA